MLKIERIRLVEIRLPLREPFQISSGTVDTRRILLLELRDVSQATAWAECVAWEEPIYFPDTIDTAWSVIRRWIAPRLLGRGLESASQVQPLLEAGLRGHQMAKAAVEMGTWGLEAAVRGVPLARLLGGSREKVATGIALGLEPTPEALAERAEASLAQGYRKIKIKIKPGFDRKYLETVRRRLGPDTPLMVDANSSYSLADLDHLVRFDEFGLAMIEQPLGWDDLVRHARLQERLATPICLDESITSLDRAEDMFTLGSGRIINIKPGRVGGFSAAIAIHDLCREKKAPVRCGGLLESGVGRAYNVALASLEQFSLPGDLSPSARYWAQDIVEPEWTMDANGLVAVPWDRPGIGVHVDMERLERLLVRSETLSAP